MEMTKAIVSRHVYDVERKILRKMMPLTLTFTSNIFTKALRVGVSRQQVCCTKTASLLACMLQNILYLCLSVCLSVCRLSVCVSVFGSVVDGGGGIN